MRDPHIAAFAVPVFAENDRLTAALALTGPVSRLTLNRKDEELGVLMREAAARLSAKLGARKAFCDAVYAAKLGCALIPHRRASRPAALLRIF